MERLINIGFQEAGSWIKGTNKSGIDYELNTYRSNTQILYSVMSDNEIFYIGKSDNSLETRMNGYKNAGGSQRTNIRVQAEIIQLLDKNKGVKIYVLVDDANYDHKGVKIRLSSGLEDNLIGLIRPKWNFRSNGHTRIKDYEIGASDDNVVFESNQTMIINTSQIMLYTIKTNEPKNGRINFPKSTMNYDLLPEFNTMVTVYLGKANDSFFEAKLIDSGGGNARINKSILKDWYNEEHLSEQETFNLEIINPTTFRIYK